MNPPIRILYVDDYPLDRELVRDALMKERVGFELIEAASRADFETALAKGGFNLVLSDFNILGFEGLQVLETVHAKDPNIPVIIVTGTGSEEVAADAIKRGASDYVIKTPKQIQRLPYMIHAALERKRLEDEQKLSKEALLASEIRYRALFENVGEGIGLVNPEERFIFANPSAESIFGVSPGNLAGRDLREFVTPEQYAAIREQTRLRQAGRKSVFEMDIRRADGEKRILLVTASPQFNNQQQFEGTFGVFRDITDRKLAEEALARQTEELRQSNAELARLYRASGSLLSGASLGLQDLAQTIVGLVQQEFGQANCSLLIIDRDSKELKRLAIASPYSDQVKDKVLTLGATGLVPQAVLEGVTLNVGNIRSTPAYLPNLGAVQSELAIPLKVGSEVIGVIDIQSDQPDAFSANDERLMATFAERAALALTHSRMYEQTKARVQQLAALRTVDIAISSSFDINLTLGILLDQVRLQLGIHAVDILVYTPSAQTLRFSCGKGFRTQALQNSRLRLGEGFAGKAALDQRVLKVADLRTEPAGFKKSPLIFGENFVAYMGVPLLAKGQIKGVLELFQRAPLDLTAEGQAYLEILAGQAAIAIDNAELFDHLQSSIADMNIAYDSTLEGWSRALDLRDKETEGHTLRVAEIAARLSRAMGVGDAELVQIHRGALLHDIGEMAVPDAILFKPGKLTAEEWAIMRQHPQLAYDMLSSIAYLHPALDIPYCHHEKWDGNGYPRGLKGEQIPLAARIFAIIDVWDGITSKRPYHPAQPEAVAMEYIRNNAGKHFDPKVTEIFLGEVIYG